MINFQFWCMRKCSGVDLRLGKFRSSADLGGRPFLSGREFWPHPSCYISDTLSGPPKEDRWHLFWLTNASKRHELVLTEAHVIRCIEWIDWCKTEVGIRQWEGGKTSGLHARQFTSTLSINNGNGQKLCVVRAFETAGLKLSGLVAQLVVVVGRDVFVWVAGAHVSTCHSCK